MARPRTTPSTRPRRKNTAASPRPTLDARLAAVRALAELPPAEAEQRAREQARREPKREVRAACMEVLGTGSSLESLEVLLAALDDHDTVARAAVNALRRFGHPQTADRVLALITPGLRALTFLPDPPLPRSYVPTPDEQRALDAKKAHDRQFLRLASLVEILGAQPSEAGIDELIALHRHHPLRAMRDRADMALCETRDRRALGVLAESVLDESGTLLSHRIWSFFHAGFDTVFDRMQPLLTPDVLATKRGLWIAETLLARVSHRLDVDADQLDQLAWNAHLFRNAPYRRTELYSFQLDPRWADVATRLLDHPTLEDDARRILANLARG